MAAEAAQLRERESFTITKNVTKMAIKSALEDLSQTTLDAVSGCLRKLEYLAGLGNWRGDYFHWGFNKVHGNGPARKAIHEAHRSVVSKVLSTPLQILLEDVESSTHLEGMNPEQYLQSLATKEKELLPKDPGAGSARHLSSVLRALLGLERHRGRNATRRVS